MSNVENIVDNVDNVDNKFVIKNLQPEKARKIEEYPKK